MNLSDSTACIAGLEERVAEFAANCVTICDMLPRGRAGASNFKDQLARSATSVAANYAEASVPSSQRDFVGRLTIALKELAESRMHLRIIARLNYHKTLHKEFVEGLISESDNLAAIFRRALAKGRRKRKVASDADKAPHQDMTDILKSAIASAKRRKKTVKTEEEPDNPLKKPAKPKRKKTKRKSRKKRRTSAATRKPKTQPAKKQIKLLLKIFEDPPQRLLTYVAPHDAT